MKQGIPYPTPKQVLPESEKQFRQLAQSLEDLVAERTRSLEQANELLHTEIMQRKAIEKDLRKSEERYRVLVETMNDGLGILDREGKVVYANKRLCEMLGYSRAALIGKFIFEFCDVRRQQLLKDCWTHRRIGQPDNFEMQWFQKGGGTLFTLVSPRIMRDPDGLVVGSFAVITDISERVNSEQALEVKNIALKEILSQIEIEKKMLQEQILANADRLLLPTLKKLRKKATTVEQNYLEVLQRNLEELTSPFGHQLSRKLYGLSPREIEVCNLIRSGLTTKEIAQMLHASPLTVEMHRNHIRKKMGLLGKKVNLTTFLQSL